MSHPPYPPPPPHTQQHPPPPPPPSHLSPAPPVGYRAPSPYTQLHAQGVPLPPSRGPSARPAVGAGYGRQAGWTGLEGQVQGMGLGSPPRPQPHAPYPPSHAPTPHQIPSPAGSPYPDPPVQHPPPPQSWASPAPPADAYSASGMEALGVPDPSLYASAPAPAKSRRPARVYHTDDIASPSSSAAPAPQGMHQHRGRPSAFSPSGADRPASFSPAASAAAASTPPTQPALPSSAPPARIPQPPHSAGQAYAGGMRAKIDPDAIPAPVQPLLNERSRWSSDEAEEYLTVGGIEPPSADVDFKAVDLGNSSPRHLRLTTYAIPHSSELAGAAQIPLALLVQPFAEGRDDEEPVPRVEDFGTGEGEEGGPPRCGKCRGYVNAWVRWEDGGRRWVCNLCGNKNDVPSSYFSALDPYSSRRLDIAARPELTHGTIDFFAPPSYNALQPAPSASSLLSSTLSAAPADVPRAPAPMSYVFAIDVSWNSVRSGLLGTLVRAVRDAIYGEGDGEGEECAVPRGARVGVVTFAEVVHYYDLSPEIDATEPRMMVVPDVDEPFVPLGNGFLVDAREGRANILALLSALPALFADTQEPHAVLGSTLESVLSGLSSTGGLLSIFQTSLPTLGLGALKERDPPGGGVDKPSALFGPADTWWSNLGERFVDAGVGVNTFLFPSRYADVGSLATIAGMTGGENFFYPRFEPMRYEEKVRADVRRVVRRQTGYNVAVRIRCSNGLHVDTHYGAFHQRNATDLELGTLHADASLAAEIAHEGAKLVDGQDAFVQAAVLYTSAEGERRVRVLNLAVKVSSVAGHVFRFADMDAGAVFLAKQAVARAFSKPLRQVREQLTDKAVKILLAYRKLCAQNNSGSQLILPESYKLIALYTLGILKSKAFKGGAVASDVRTHYLRYLATAPPAVVLAHLYPRMMAVHALADDEGFPSPKTGRLRLPPLMRDSYARMEPHGAYLIENGEFAILWLGSAVSPQILQDLYAVENQDEIDHRLTSLPRLPTRLSTQLRNILAYLSNVRGRGRTLPVLIARQNTDAAEIEFGNMLVEDQNNDAMSYVDYLCFVHKQITQAVSGEARQMDAADAATWRAW